MKGNTNGSECLKRRVGRIVVHKHKPKKMLHWHSKKSAKYTIKVDSVCGLRQYNVKVTSSEYVYLLTMQKAYIYNTSKYRYNNKVMQNTKQRHRIESQINV